MEKNNISKHTGLLFELKIGLNKENSIVIDYGGKPDAWEQKPEAWDQKTRAGNKSLKPETIFSLLFLIVPYFSLKITIFVIFRKTQKYLGNDRT